MTLLVVLVLVVLWAAVLGPLLVRRLRDGEPSGSVDSFYHELHLLERAAPKTVVPANRLDTAYTDGIAPGSSGYPSVSSTPGRPSLVLVEPVGSSGRPDGHGAEMAGDAGQPGLRRLALAPDPAAGHGPERRRPSTLAARDHAYRVRRCRRRRRDILFGLLATAAVSGPLGVVHSFRALWVFTALSMVLLVVYVFLLVRTHRVAMARRASRRGLPVPAQRARGAELGEQGEEPTYLRRLAALGEAEPSWADPDDSAWAARAGYPGAWDGVPPRVAVGG